MMDSSNTIQKTYFQNILSRNKINKQLIIIKEAYEFLSFLFVKKNYEKRSHTKMPQQQTRLYCY